MADDPTKIDPAQFDDPRDSLPEATTVATDTVIFYRPNTTGWLYGTVQDIIDLAPDPSAALSGGILGKDDLSASVDGESTAFPLSVTPESVDHLIVVLGGVVLTEGYSLTDATLTFTEAPEDGTPLVVYILSNPVEVEFLSDNANNILTESPKFWVGTTANYDALGVWDSNTIYFKI